MVEEGMESRAEHGERMIVHAGKKREVCVSDQ